MQNIVGKDNNGRMNVLGVVSNTGGGPGFLLSRPLLSKADLFHNQVVLTPGVVGLNDVDSPAVPTGFIYVFNDVIGFHTGGTVTFIQLIHVSTANSLIHTKPTAALNDATVFNGSLYLGEGDIVRARFNTTVAPAIMILAYHGYRIPVG